MRGRTSSRQSPRLSAGKSWRAALLKPSALHARKQRILRGLAARAWPVLHRLGLLFLSAFQFRAVPAAAGALRAVEVLRDTYASGGRRWPRSLPTSFLRPAWRDAVLGAATDRRIWETATLLALRDRLRAGDIWVE